MAENKHFIKVLNNWLSTADRNYIQGRYLWMRGGTVGGNNLLWLSIEQLMKILLLQKNKELLNSSSESFEDIDSKTHKVAFQYEKENMPDELINSLVKEYDFDLSHPHHMLKDMCEFYRHKYSSITPTTQSLLLHPEIDKVFFMLRDKIDPIVGVSLIDMLEMDKEKGNSISEINSCVFKNNEHFRSRYLKANN
ncbi:hypothetical protein [Marinigracilibium pacificum]|uniref:Uncharacterized protein n=1 Tax=Marinigracilibium pacificum TaxID=2729599 RepID=A0A848J167_9BACT|nr:hypothetical protein [Marinigracilibium pacificum]NMM48290.1 hypothetical protein [Marinigracilibium pacificum]